MINNIKYKFIGFIKSLNFSGIVMGIIFYCFAMLPSLLPRPALFQALLSGVSLLIGYGFGVFISHTTRWLIQQELVSEHKKTIMWKVLIMLAITLFIVFIFLGGVWQDNVRQLVGETPKGNGSALLVAILSLFTFVILLLISRFIRKITGLLNSFIAKFLPHRLSVAIGFSLVTIFFVWIISGVFYNFFVSTARQIYSSKNNSSPINILKPQSKYISGSPESLISWDSLGYQGQLFAGKLPSQANLKSFYGKDVKEPIRIYAGINSANNAQDRAKLALQELKRTDAFNRKILILASPTGTGWIEPQSIDAIEYMFGGDSAIVVQQYSYLPSWISFLVDKQNSEEASLALYDAVFSEWSKLPIDSRPKLIAYGLSLGSFGAQAPFAGIGDITASIDGALFEGTPNDTRLWRMVTNNRDKGSPEILPIYQNDINVRFASNNKEITDNLQSWDYPRTLYMQHASDPVVWFSFDLMFKKPDWLKEPRGPDVSTNMYWFPVVTFFQVSIDQMFGTSVPPGHGHNYSNTLIDSLVAVTNPPNWNDQKYNNLQNIID